MLIPNKKTLEKSDIISNKDYAFMRRDVLKTMAEQRMHSRIAVGPDVTFYFENVGTIWFQIQEMLLAEGGGDEQLQEELEAYTPLIPGGNSMVATMMIEIEDEIRRKIVLEDLKGIEKHVYLTINGEKMKVDSLNMIESNLAKTFSVHFFKFDITSHIDFIESEVVLGINHPKYSYSKTLELNEKDMLYKYFLNALE